MSDLVLTTLDQLVARALTGQPARSDGKPLNSSVVYSHLPSPRPVDPREFANPWSPMGGSTLQDDAAARGVTPAGGEGAEAPEPPGDDKFRRAMAAAFRTSELVDTLLMVTKDGSYKRYAGGGRKVSFAYENIINAMQPVPSPPRPAELQARIDAAHKVLYELDEEGNVLGPSELFRRYQRNARAYAQAKADFALQQSLILNDASRADSWPMLAAPLQRAVDDAWENFQTWGTEKVEEALDTLQSVGESLTGRSIAQARKLFEAWKLNLAGVPTQTVYSEVSPGRWYDAEEDIGFTRFTITESEARTHSTSTANSWARGFAESRSRTSEGAGGVTFGFVTLGGGGGTTSSSSSSGTSSGSTSTYEFNNDASGLTVEIEWGMCDIVRPACVFDLFHMDGWYMVGQPAHAISDGTIDGQAEDASPLMPAVPVQLLVIRKVKVTASDWGSDGRVLTQMQADERARAESGSGSVKGGATVSLGFVNFGGGGGHSWNDSSSDWWNTASTRQSFESGWRFDGSTLEITGAQIVGWVSHVLPPCPPLPDPGLAGPPDADEPAEPAEPAVPVGGGGI